MAECESVSVAFLLLNWLQINEPVSIIEIIETGTPFVATLSVGLTLSLS